jgi:mannose-6-phosphate isomerase
VKRVGPGDSVDFGIGVLHRIHNVGITDVIFVEVQTGTYFGEDDIERVEDDFGR